MAGSLALGVLGVVGGGGIADAQTWSSWSVFWENDSFVPPGYQSDAAYTNGVRFSLGRNPELSWKWANAVDGLFGRLHLKGNDPFTTTNAVVFGQNFFTPVVITTFDPDPTDRPFVAFLYGGARADVTEDPPPEPNGFDVRLQHSVELDGGFLGPLALADQVQTGVHLLRQSRIPKGWERQMGTEVAVNGSYLGRAKVGWHFLDVVPHAGFALGTVQTFGNAGATGRIGWNMSAFPTLIAPWTAAPVSARPPWEISFLAGIEWRYYLRNAYVDGGVLGSGPSVEGRPSVRDSRFGFTGRYRGTWISYTFVHRTPEFDTPPALGDGEHDYGSVSFTHELGRPGGSGTRSWLTRDWTLEAGIGGGSSRNLSGGDADRTDDGMSMRFGVAKGIVGRLALGWETIGVLRQGRTEDLTARHRDTFLLNRAFTVAWRPAVGPGDLIFRAGGGSALVKVEVTRGLEHEPEREDTGSGWLAGLGYDWPLGRTISFGADATWSRLNVASADGPDASFVSGTLGFKWHP